MKNTEKSAAQWQEIVSEKDKEIAQLRKQVDWFKGQSKQFGPSSEKSVELEEHTSLFNEPETLADPKAVEPDSYTRGKSGPANGNWIFLSCPRENRFVRYAAGRCTPAAILW